MTQNISSSLPGVVIPQEVLTSIADGLSVHDRNFRIIYQNQVLQDLVGDCVGESCHEVYQKRGQQCDGCPVAACFADGQIHSSERVLVVGGKRLYMENIASPIRDHDGNIVAAVEVLRDVTSRKEAEENLIRSTNLYDALSKTNSAIMHCHDRDSLFSEICQVAVEHGKFCLAVIAVVDSATGMVTPVAYSGRATSYLDSLCISADSSCEMGKGPTGIAIRSGVAYICNDYLMDSATAPWREVAFASNINASAVFPLKQGAEIVCVLKVYSEEKGFFEDKMVELLIEMTENISFALENFHREEQRKKAEEALRESEERLKLVLEGSNDGFWDFDLRSRTASFSNRFVEMLGYTREEVESTLTGISKLIYGEDLPLMRKLLADEALTCSGTCEIEVRMLTRSGDWAWVLFRGKVVAKDADGAPLRVAGTTTDISDRKAYEENLHHVSTHDALTGLFNRAYFDSEFARMQVSRHYPVSVVIADVDGLKRVNDSFGHAEGDRLIKQAARALREAFRAEDVIARVGGDEFAILLPETDAEVAKDVVKRFRQRVEQINEENSEYILSVSIGAATAERPNQLNEAMKLADSRMYYYKFQRKGRGK